MLLSVFRRQAHVLAPRAAVSMRMMSSGSDGELREELTPFKTHRCDGPEGHSITTKEENLLWYKEMSIMRRMEIMADSLYKQRMIRGFCHLYDGQEAVAMGMKDGLSPDDYVITAYRDHCHQYTSGDSVESIMAELLGKRTGCSKGKGGSMHMYNPKGNFFGGNGIVGAQIPLGVGLAFASKYRGDNRVAVSMYGDGAANQGQLFEASNMAALWKIPAIFLCENNQYGMGTSTARGSASSEFYTRGDYIPGIQADGMDVLAVRETMRWASNYCREGNGPIFIEMKTYRYHGHSMSDPGLSYRSRDEVSAVRAERDCIAKVKNRILANEWSTEADLKAIDKEIKQLVDKAIKAAKGASELSIDEVYTDIYADTSVSFVRYPDFQNSKYPSL